MRTLARNVLLLILGAGLVWPAVPAVAKAPGETKARAEIASKSLVLLPLANYTGKARAIELARKFVHESLESLLVDYHSERSIRPLLREHRIRAVGEIGERGARTLRDLTGADWLLCGSVDVYREAAPPEFAVSVRVVDARTLQVLAAASVGHSARETEGLFGSPAKERLEELARRAVSEAVAELERQLARTERDDGAEQARPRVCVVPFDDSEEGHGDGGIVSDLMLSSLVRAGYPCLEPGVVRETFLNLGRVYRGEIDVPTLKELARAHQISFVVTGAVEVFQPIRGSSPSSVPHFSASARLLSARTGRLLDAWYDERSGRETETVFQRGRTYSAVKLASDSLGEFLKRLEKVSRNVENQS